MSGGNVVFLAESGVTMISRCNNFNYIIFTISGIYLTISMAVTSISVILTVCVLKLHHCGPHQVEVGHHHHHHHHHRRRRRRRRH